MMLGFSILLTASLLLLGAIGFWFPRGSQYAEAGLGMALVLATGFGLIWSLESSLRFDEF